MVNVQAALIADLLPRPERGAIDPTQLADRFHAAAVRTVRRNEPVLDVLRQRYQLAVVSNFTGNLERCLDELAIRSYFDVVTDSAVHGLTKPDPGLFTRTLAALGLPASAAWMIGDNPVADIQPARALGIRTVWIAPARRRLPAGLAPTARIARFADLPAVVRQAETSCTA